MDSGLRRVAHLDPDTFRHDAPEPPVGQVAITQQDYGMQVRGIAELHVPCKCGRPLCGLEHEWIHDGKGSALHVTGVCLSCGVQSAIYLSDPILQRQEDHEARRAQRMRQDIERMLAAVTACVDRLETDEIELKETA